MLVNILMGLGSLVAVLLIIALFVKKQYAIEREITINKSKAEVFNFIKYLKNQEQYSKWVQTDPNMEKDFRGTDGTVGFVYAWNGNKKAGEGEQEIKAMKEGESLEVEVRFIRPFTSVAQTPFTTETVSANQTKVKWGMRGANPYPLNLMNVFMSGLLGKDLEISLTNLKTVLEKSPLSKN